MPTTLSQKISPMLWFNANAEEAVALYTGIFHSSRVVQTTRFGAHGPGAPGSVMTITFEIAGQQFTALNGGPQFTFSEAISLVVSCDSQQEIDDLWTKLTSGGGAPVQCGWLRDRFGLSWQIVPREFWEFMLDPAKAERVMPALMGMVKPDLAALRRAASGT